ncbi:hypothetical protein [Marinomonas shanghaiensis]|uniref:hypothetical protein n=1 Tax=Marinomonas shanghaiensis TaxID=2202418 RepID=UPI003A942302
MQHVAVNWCKQFIAKTAEAPTNFISKLGVVAKVVALDSIDGLRITLDNSDMVHLHPSGNAPELRCHVESASTDKAQLLLVTCLNYLSALH